MLFRSRGVQQTLRLLLAGVVVGVVLGAVTSLLSFAAALGVTVAVFQQGVADRPTASESCCTVWRASRCRTPTANPAAARWR